MCRYIHLLSNTVYFESRGNTVINGYGDESVRPNYKAKEVTVTKRHLSVEECLSIKTRDNMKILNLGFGSAVI